MHRLRWPDGFRYPRCRHHEAWQIGRGLNECKHGIYLSQVHSPIIYI
ncbi:MAG: hypothetical protein JRG73_16510 [Deltaproteobacteria bacterium]|nr:hypothetical protein [Deltaproteobacteria bacterium]MBW2308530.1 hypothetical protein [Deltaproteobacteria bacterium]